MGSGAPRTQTCGQHRTTPVARLRQTLPGFKRKERGFPLTKKIRTLLLLLVLAIVGFFVWYLWRHAKRAAGPSNKRRRQLRPHLRTRRLHQSPPQPAVRNLGHFPSQQSPHRCHSPPRAVPVSSHRRQERRVPRQVLRNEDANSQRAGPPFEASRSSELHIPHLTPCLPGIR